MDEISWLEVSGLIPQAVPSERMLGMSVLVPESQVERSGEEPSYRTAAPQTPAAGPPRGPRQARERFPCARPLPIPNVLVLLQ